MLNINRRLVRENPASTIIPAPLEMQAVLASDTAAAAPQPQAGFWSGNAPYYVAGALLLFAVLGHKR